MQVIRKEAVNKYSATDYGYDDEAHARILDKVGVAVITIDSEGHILDTDVFAETIFGISKVDMQGQNVSMLMLRDHARHHDGYRQHHRSTGEKRMIGKQRHGRGKESRWNRFSHAFGSRQAGGRGSDLFQRDHPRPERSEAIAESGDTTCANRG